MDVSLAVFIPFLLKLNISITIAYIKLERNIPGIIIMWNEREEFMQETQHTQQTATRKAQNQDKKTA